MALLTDEFTLAWNSMTGESGGNGWQSIPVAHAGPCHLFAAKRFPENRESLLVHFQTVKIPVAEKLPEGGGFTIERVDPYGDEKTWLALTRKEFGSIELFVTMVGNVVDVLNAEATSSEERLLAIFLGRVRAWQEFMRKGVHGLEPEAEIGLIGELSFLLTMLEEGISVSSAIESWVGPLDGIQDFEIGTGAVEVKTTISITSFSAKIGSLDQLDDSIRQPLFLAGIRLSQGESGQNLPEFVERVRQVVGHDMEARRLFADRLLVAGYLDAHLARYSRRFTIVEKRLIEVDDEFPRITHGVVPTGIKKAIYEIDLDKATGKRLSPGIVFKKLGVL